MAGWCRSAILAKVTRSYEDPPTSLFRYNGEPAIGLAVGMVKGGNILEVGKTSRPHASG